MLPLILNISKIQRLVMMNDYATFPVAFALIAAVLEKAKEGLAFS